MLFKTTNGGQSWQPISPDLTRNDKTKLGASGGPITKDNTSVEYYCTIFTAVESPLEIGLLWAGSDDGLIHVSKDGGKHWQNVTPPDLPEWSQINSIEPHRSEKGGLYVAATRYKSDDFKPYLYKTLDYGKTWTKIVAGIKDDHFTRVIRASSKRAGLLFAGTESGLYISFDDGSHWQKFQLNLPLVPITDLALKNDDLIVATQGRAFWVLDDLTALYQFKPAIAEKPAHLFEPRSAYRLPGGGGFGGAPRADGQNPPTGVTIHYRLKEAPAKDAKIALEILDATGKVVRTFTPKAEKPGDKIEPKAGVNRIVWDLHYPGAEIFPGMILWGGLPEPRAVPGPYQVHLKVGDHTETAGFQVQPDPRGTATTADLDAQFRFLVSARDKLTETHKAIKQIRDLREQFTNLNKRVKDQEVTDAAKALDKSLTAVEEALYQTKAKSQQDVLNFPIRLNNRLSSLADSVAAGDNAPTDQALKLKDELTAAIDAELLKLQRVVKADLARFNELLARKKVPGVFSEQGGAKKQEP